MPDIFEVACKDNNKNITVVCGDSYSRSYIVEEAEEVVFQSPSFNYQIPLVQLGNEWVLQMTGEQTQIIEEGSYKYQIRVKYANGEVKTKEEGIITFAPSVFPMYKTYPVVIKTTNPTPLDNKYGVPTIWYNSENETLWVLESSVGRVANWRKTSNLSYIYQTGITEDFKFAGDTSMFSLLKVTDNTNISFIQGSYNIHTDKTEYNIDLKGLLKADFYLYIDKTIEQRDFLNTFDNEINKSMIIYKYTYIKDSQEEVETLRQEITNNSKTLSEEQLLIIRDMVNAMITEAKFPHEVEGE